MSLDPHLTVQLKVDHRSKCKRLSNKLPDENRENLCDLSLGNERLQACGHEGYVHFLDCSNSFTVYMTPKSQLMEGTSLGRRMSESIITLNLGPWGPQLVSSPFPTSTLQVPPGDWSSGPSESMVQGNHPMSPCHIQWKSPSPLCIHRRASTCKKDVQGKDYSIPSCLIIPTERFTLIVITTTIITAVQLF